MKRYMVFLLLCFAATDGMATASDTVSASPKNLDVFVFPSYDTDTGIGAGAKAFFLNYAGWNESLDLAVYASAKDERWVRIAYSMPDLETRQGKIFPFALDVVAEYDKMLLANFFPGYANGTDAGLETYTREPIELILSLSRGFTPRFSATASAKFKSVSNFNFKQGSAITSTGVEADHGVSSFASVSFIVRYDSRDSYINPHEGLVLQAELEKGSHSFAGTRNGASRVGAIVQWYTELIHPSTIAAVRVSLQSLSEDRAPLWMKYMLGGTYTLRGFAMDRFVGDAMALSNCELRFPLYRRLGGVLFADAGMVSASVDKLRVASLHSSAGFGLRLSFDTFVVRADLGASAESAGLYLSFSHLF